MSELGQRFHANFGEQAKGLHAVILPLGDRNAIERIARALVGYGYGMGEAEPESADQFNWFEKAKDAHDLLMQNVNFIADELVRVVRECDQSPDLALSAAEVVRGKLMHYEEVRQLLDDEQRGTVQCARVLSGAGVTDPDGTLTGMAEEAAKLISALRASEAEWRRGVALLVQAAGGRIEITEKQQMDFVEPGDVEIVRYDRPDGTMVIDVRKATPTP